ncbi:MAG TPA: hypothetical protein VF145_10545 [Chitinophagaceae bacterium]
MKGLLTLFSGLLISLSGLAQHYYNDVISNQLSNANYNLLKQANFTQVKGVSYEADGSPTTNFQLQQELSRDKKTLTTTTTSPGNVTNVIFSYYENDRLARTEDTISGVKNTAYYHYDDAGRLIRILSKSVDPEHTGNMQEDHQWFYLENGKPSYMLKIKNGADTLRVEFVYDDQDNPAEERWFHQKRQIETYYYYYNNKQQLTDIVRYNRNAKKMLPDFIFEYDSTGRVSQMMQTLQGTASYLLWQYIYNENGLKQKEVCYDKQKRLVGSVEYSYSR